jgi:hypothetical protein
MCLPGIDLPRHGDCRHLIRRDNGMGLSPAPRGAVAVALRSRQPADRRMTRQDRAALQDLMIAESYLA